MNARWIYIAAIASIQILVVDLFCGAGGTTSGFEKARVKGKKVVTVILCVNHDPNAIRSHAANHPHTVHMTEDIRIQAMEPIVRVVTAWRAMCPWAKVVLWGSLECTNHSNAKGGDSRDADSRSLADHLDRYIVAINPDYVWIENVREFRQWGPLIHKRDKKGKLMYHKDKTTKEMVPTMKPDKTQLCIYFNAWVKRTSGLGYTYQDVDLNAANFNAHQNRVRYFGSFARIGQKHVFPKPFTKKGRPVREVLDFTDEGESIFDPNRKKKITSPKTYERILAGVIKHILPGQESWIIKYNGHKDGIANPDKSIHEPSPTIYARRTIGTGKVIYHPAFMMQMNGNNNRSSSTESPAKTVTTTGGKQYILKTDFITQYYGDGGAQNPSLDNPCPALTTKDRVSKLRVKYMIDNQFGQSKPSSVNQPCGTILRNPKQNLIKAVWIDNRYGSGDHNHQSIHSPCGTILGVPKQAVMTPKFVMNHNFNNPPTSVDQPMPTILASRKYYYIINPSFANKGSSTNKPSPAVIARQDKKPLSLTTCEISDIPMIIMQETEDPKDLPVDIRPCGVVEYNLPSGKLLEKGTKKIRAYYKSRRALLEVMAAYGIVDIKMRMLKIIELLKIQGFPENYKLIGTQSEQKKYIGNAVHVSIPKKWGTDAAEMFIQETLKQAV